MHLISGCPMYDSVAFLLLALPEKSCQNRLVFPSVILYSRQKWAVNVVARPIIKAYELPKKCWCK